MTDSRGATDETGTSDDIQRLQDRIKELEQQLKSRNAAARPVSTSRSGNQVLKILTAALAAVSVVMALPAFLTIRRWYDWWR